MLTRRSYAIASSDFDMLLVLMDDLSNRDLDKCPYNLDNELNRL